MFSSLRFLRCHQSLDRCSISSKNYIHSFSGQLIRSKKSRLKYVILIFSRLCLEVSELQKKNTEEVGSASSSRSMEDILEENAALKYQNKWLIDVITKNLTELSGRIQKNTEEVSLVQEDVSSVK